MLETNIRIGDMRDKTVPPPGIKLLEDGHSCPSVFGQSERDKNVPPPG